MNVTLQQMGPYLSKAISEEAKKNPEIRNLSIGEPVFGPPDFTIENIEKQVLTMPTLLDALKRYETARGSLPLRKLISDWYQQRYGLSVNPDKEILITHGGVEAVALAVLCTSNVGDEIVISDPTYMLYERSIATMGRKPVAFDRRIAQEEYADNAEALERSVADAGALVINSPENPTGYILSEGDWRAVARVASKYNKWVIHDEVYDTMAYYRTHTPVRAVPGLEKKGIMINSCSKKFGVPGLRIGWLVADEKIVDLACKAHDHLYLGVNILSEKLAIQFLSNNNIQAWFTANNDVIKNRMATVMKTVNEEHGFNWNRKPFGGMFLFPNVAKYYDTLPDKYKDNTCTIGECVAHYLLMERKVAVIPGAIYGKMGNDNIRLVLCTTEDVFEGAITNFCTSVSINSEK